MKKANRLINESSPYLQQHAYNPVDWHPWGEDALEKAKEENKPILVSIGYSTCHWCHVMERESFEDEEVAAYMNAHFINIKVDREERPDVDSIYMEAVQLIQNGQGGWPLNCFLLPDGKPFFGGTYFPPQPAYRRASWMQVLSNLKTAFESRREDVEAQANKVLSYIKQAQEQFVSNIELPKDLDSFSVDSVNNSFENLKGSFDSINGGFGAAPKFPGTMALEFCYNYYLAEKKDESLNHLYLSLDKMALGGIYDHLGGGFARYTVDEAWLVPHFEKMLYDNALLVSLYADVYKLSKKRLYKQRIEETLVWVEREMLSKEGGFFSALDADSEGVEGKFYVWDKSEIEAILGEKEIPSIGNRATVFCAYYNITEEGNWEHKNIINVPIALHEFIKNEKITCSESEFEVFLKDCRTELLAVRAERIRPGLDDKILLDWNAMMIKAYLKAYQALGNIEYKTRALATLDFILKKFKISNDSLHLYHSYKEGKAKHHAFLDDYALLIEALLEAYFSTQESQYKILAKDYTDFVSNEFRDVKDNLYYFTSAKQQDILLHKKVIYDSATPSGNSIMVHNLQKIGVLFDEKEYRAQASKTLYGMLGNIEKYPQSFGKWANALFLEVYPLKTITINAKGSAPLLEKLQKEALWNTFVLEPKLGNERGEKVEIVVCKDYTCHLPVQTLEEALDLL